MKDIEISLIPISELESEDNVTFIPLSKIEYFAFIATTLTPMDAFTEIDGYTSALWEYMQDKKYIEKEQFTFYDKLIHANSGYNLLTNLIELFLVEKEIRNNGLTSQNDRKYQKLLNEYRYLLNELKRR